MVTMVFSFASTALASSSEFTEIATPNLDKVDWSTKNFENDSKARALFSFLAMMDIIEAHGSGSDIPLLEMVIDIDGASTFRMRTGFDSVSCLFAYKKDLITFSYYFNGYRSASYHAKKETAAVTKDTLQFIIDFQKTNGMYEYSYVNDKFDMLNAVNEATELIGKTAETEESSAQETETHQSFDAEITPIIMEGKTTADLENDSYRALLMATVTMDAGSTGAEFSIADSDGNYGEYFILTNSSNEISFYYIWAQEARSIIYFIDSHTYSIRSVMDAETARAIIDYLVERSDYRSYNVKANELINAILVIYERVKAK